MNAFGLSPFKQLIRTRCGLLLEGVGEEPLVVALKKRIAELGLSGEAAYYARLIGDEGEFQEFVTLLTINETYFYREPEQLTLLVERLVPRLLGEEGGRLPLRILSAGCSTGEEPYSIAMALLEKFGESAARMVRIMGGDIDHHALAKARAGRYTAFSFRGLPAALQDKYFRPFGRDGREIDERIRSMVEFHHLNLLVSPFPSLLGELDVVFFRNVSIYFDEATRRQIQRGFLAAMSPRGRLVVGSAETLANDLGLFRLVEEGGAFHFSRSGGAEPRPALPPRPVAPSPVPPRPAMSVPPPRPAAVAVPVREAGPDVEAIRALIRDKRLDRVEMLLSPNDPCVAGDARLCALAGYARALTKDFPAAVQWAGRALAADEWSPDGMMLRGLAAKWGGDEAEALGWFKKAVYVRPECWPAQYYLAESHRAAGAEEVARRAYRVALRLLDEGADADGGLVLPLGLPVGHVRFLCGRHAGPPARAAGR